MLMLTDKLRSYRADASHAATLHKAGSTTFSTITYKLRDKQNAQRQSACCIHAIGQATNLRMARERAGRAVQSQCCASPDKRLDTTTKPKVVGLGSVGVDYLAQVARFPKPDEKLRTEKMETRGGGNCANALTAAARLGLDTYLVSKVGDDSIGDEIEQELLCDGVNTQFLLKAQGHPSPFTYIIVDKQGGTRTCIHTPGASYLPENLTPDTISQALANAQLVYFDGRLTESAVVLARAARQQGVPVLVEAERLRPNLEVLLGQADYVCTSAHFPQQWTGEATLGDALHTSIARLPRARFLITTLGKKGSVLIARSDRHEAAQVAAGETNQEAAQEAAEEAQEGQEAARETTQEAVLEDLLNTMLKKVASGSPAGNENGDRDGDGGSKLGCTARDGTHIKTGQITSTGQPLKLHLHRSPGDSPEATAAAEKAASAEASANADSSNAAAYARDALLAVATEADDVIGTVTVASAATIPQEAIEDTTGAGDAFIGTILYGIIHKLPHDKMLQLAAVVAACKCTALGARPGLPHAADIDADMLTA